MIGERQNVIPNQFSDAGLTVYLNRPGFTGDC